MQGAKLSKDFNVNLLLEELENRDVRCTPVTGTSFIELKKGKKLSYLYDITASTSPFSSTWIASDKYYTKQFLKHIGFPVTNGKAFSVDNIEVIADYARSIGYPLVVKPTTNSHGNYVYVNVQNEEKLREKITLIADERGGNGYVLIEQYFPGEEYRFFITKKGFFAALHRTPACIVGDGHQPIITLIQEENYRRMNPRKNCLCEIRLDDILFEYLEEQQLSINDILPKGKKIFLRQTSNVSKGGNCRDVTSEVHPSFRSFAKKVLASIPDLSVVGIDLLCQDHMVELREQKYVICELNQSPGLSLHEMPEHGRRRKVTIALADLVMESTL